MKNVYSSYSWIRGDYDNAATNEELVKVKSKLDDFLRRISPEAKTFFLQTTEYFPHVATESLQNGFYSKFNALQGETGLYYATPLISFETMDGTIRMTEDLVQKYF